MSVVINGTTVITDSGTIPFSRLTGIPSGIYYTGDVTGLAVSNCAAAGMSLSTSGWTFHLRGGDTNCQNCTNCNCYVANCTVCGSCFIAGTKVHMADGTLKNIEDVMVGDVVLTSHGHDVVKELWQPLLGPRPLIRMSDGSAAGSSDHPFWSRNPMTKDQFWCTRDFDAWMAEVEMGVGSWFDGVMPFDLSGKPNQAWEYATLEGFKYSTWEFVPASPDTQLYHLLLENHGGYFADGYLAITQADKCGVDWTKFVWNGHPLIKSDPIKLMA